MHRWARLQHRVFEALNQGWHWLHSARHLEAWAVIIMVAIVLLAQALGYHEAHLPWMPANGDEVPRDWHPPDLLALSYHYLAPYLKLLGLLGGIVLHVALLRARHDMRRLLVPVWLACVCFAFLLAVADFQSQWRELNELIIGKPFPLAAYALKIVLQTLAVLSPAMALSYYQASSTWERYVLRLYAEPFAICLAAFCSLWLLADWIDNIRDFQDADVPVARLLSFYFGLLPFVWVQCLPPVLLLALLYAMTRMVKGNEMVALVGCGLSPWRILRPMLLSATLMCMVSLAFNYDWASRGEGERQALLRAMKSGSNSSVMATAVMHYDAATRRQWFIGAVPYHLRDEKLKAVQVRQFDEQGQLEQSWFGATAYWWGAGKWAFFRGQHLDYRNTDGTPKIKWFNPPEGGQQSIEVLGWKETLWDLVSSTQKPEVMGVVDLRRRQQTLEGAENEVTASQCRAELWHRFALPWQGLFLILAAASFTPLHARRGLWQGVGLSLGLYFALLFMDNLTLSLARAGRTPPGVVWLPHLFLAQVALTRFPPSAVPSHPEEARKRRRTWRQFFRVLRGRCTHSTMSDLRARGL